jgi:hypothetical protein
VYIFRDDEDAIEGSECLSDLLDLTGSNVGEGSEDDLFVSSE